VKAKIRVPLSFKKNGHTYGHAHWKHKPYLDSPHVAYPNEFYDLMQRDIEVTIIESLTPMHGEYKFISPRDGKVYWIPVNWLKPILKVDF